MSPVEIAPNVVASSTVHQSIETWRAQRETHVGQAWFELEDLWQEFEISQTRPQGVIESDEHKHRLLGLWKMMLNPEATARYMGDIKPDRLLPNSASISSLCGLQIGLEQRAIRELYASLNLLSIVCTETGTLLKTTQNSIAYHKTRRRPRQLHVQRYGNHSRTCGKLLIARAGSNHQLRKELIERILLPSASLNAVDTEEAIGELLIYLLRHRNQVSAEQQMHRAFLQGEFHGIFSSIEAATAWVWQMIQMLESVI